MGTVREEIAARIRADHPHFRVDDYPSTPAQVATGRPYVDVYVTDVTNTADTRLTHSIRLDCYASRTAGAEAELEAETIRDDVLTSLQRLEHVDWSTAQRSIFQEQFIGYQITAEFTSRHVYAERIRTEQQEQQK